MATGTLAEYQKYNPARRPQWRWDRIREIVGRRPTPGRCARSDDNWIRQAVAFMRRWDYRDERGRLELHWENRGFDYAREIFMQKIDDPKNANIIEARLLAGQSFTQIAEIVATLPTTIEWYEAIFFNVAPYLQARDWIIAHVIIPAFSRYPGRHGNVYDDDDDEQAPAADGTQNDPYWAPAITRPFLDASMKLFAYCGGPLLVDLMTTAMQLGKPLRSLEDFGRWCDEQWAVIIKRRSTEAALQFTINKFNVMDLMALHARIQEFEKSDESEERTKSAAHRHIMEFVRQVQYPVGNEPGDPRLLSYEKTAAELRDDELLRVAGGEDDKAIADEVYPLELPPPPKRQGSGGGAAGAASGLT